VRWRGIRRMGLRGESFLAVPELRGVSVDFGCRYWAFKNSQSMDGLPGMRRGVDTMKRENVTPIKKMVGAYALETSPPRTRPGQMVPLWSLVIVALLSFSLGAVGALFAALQLGLLVR